MSQISVLNHTRYPYRSSLGPLMGPRPAAQTVGTSALCSAYLKGRPDSPQSISASAGILTRPPGLIVELRIPLVLRCLIWMQQQASASALGTPMSHQRRSARPRIPRGSRHAREAADTSSIRGQVSLPPLANLYVGDARHRSQVVRLLIIYRNDLGTALTFEAEVSCPRTTYSPPPHTCSDAAP